jgi:hypothetical protein
VLIFRISIVLPQHALPSLRFAAGLISLESITASALPIGEFVPIKIVRDFPPASVQIVRLTNFHFRAYMSPLPPPNLSHRPNPFLTSSIFWRSILSLLNPIWTLSQPRLARISLASRLARISLCHSISAPFSISILITARLSLTMFSSASTTTMIPSNSLSLDPFLW